MFRTILVLLLFCVLFFSASAQIDTAANKNQHTIHKIVHGKNNRRQWFTPFNFSPKDTLPKLPVHVSFLILTSPKEYKTFDEDPLQLFSHIGTHVGINFLLRLQPWKLDSLGYLQMLSVNYGVTRGSFAVEYLGIFHQLLGQWNLDVKGRYDGPAVENFFGIGNETIKSGSRTYNRTKSTRFFGGLGIDRTINDRHHIELSGFYQTVKVLHTDGRYISKTGAVDSSVFSNKKFAGAEAGFRFRHVNDASFPTKGFNFSIGGGYVDELKNSRSFTNLLSSFAFYIPLGKSFSIASRVGGATLNGDADFYHLNKLGGYVNLRGYVRERFYGKTTFYNNNDLRWITSLSQTHPERKIGLLAFYDEGRVWQTGQTSNLWHKGYGGGVILIPRQKVVLTGTVAHSTENTVIELKAGLFF